MHSFATDSKIFIVKRIGHIYQNDHIKSLSGLEARKNEPKSIIKIYYRTTGRAVSIKYFLGSGHFNNEVFRAGQFWF